VIHDIRTELDSLIQLALDDRRFSHFSAIVGSTDADILFRFDKSQPKNDPAQIYDIASLTKVVATTTLVMNAIDRSLVELDTCASSILPEWQHTPLAQVTISTLLSHQSGLIPWLPLYSATHSGSGDMDSTALNYIARYGYDRKLVIAPLDKRKRIYSDLNFIALGILLKRIFGQPIERVFASEIVAALPSNDMFFGPASDRKDIIPTSHNIAPGVVNDDNCKHFGGASGHAGLFATIEALHTFCTWITRILTFESTDIRPETIKPFIQNTQSLGWNRPSSQSGRPSSSGHYFDPSHSIGHLAFTGPSIWIDLKQKAWIILCCNRTQYGPQTKPLQKLRPILHDLLYSIIRGSKP